MHGAAAKTPITLVENASRADERVVATTLVDLAQCHQTHAFQGPILSLYGLPPVTQCKLCNTSCIGIWRNGPTVHR